MNPPSGCTPRPPASPCRHRGAAPRRPRPCPRVPGRCCSRWARARSAGPLARAAAEAGMAALVVRGQDGPVAEAEEAGIALLSVDEDAAWHRVHLLLASAIGARPAATGPGTRAVSCSLSPTPWPRPSVGPPPSRIPAADPRLLDGARTGDGRGPPPGHPRAPGAGEPGEHRAVPDRLRRAGSGTTAGTRGRSATAGGRGARRGRDPRLALGRRRRPARTRCREGTGTGCVHGGAAPAAGARRPGAGPASGRRSAAPPPRRHRRPGRRPSGSARNRYVWPRSSWTPPSPRPTTHRPRCGCWTS